MDSHRRSSQQQLKTISTKNAMVLLPLMLLCFARYAAAAPQVFNVRSFNARGDGVTDDTQAFLAAWNAACQNQQESTLFVPPGRYLVYPVTFQGPCRPQMTFFMDGAIVAPSYDSWEGPRNTWIMFSKAMQFTLAGTPRGAFDGSGSTWWPVSCKRSNSPDCEQAGPTAVYFVGGRDITVRGVTVRNSPMFNLAFVTTTGVHATGVQIMNPGTSPNTDGIHLSGATDTLIDHANIATGDDCVSIGPDTKGVVVDSITCGPGHGISIGSLGKGDATENVSDILIQNSFLHDTTNGARIKTWEGGNGLASKIRFHNMKMSNVANPIIIDQFYCDSPTKCAARDSAVQVSDITFSNIAGTSTTDVGTKLACSSARPCRDIVLTNIDLKLASGADADAFCANALSGNGILPENCR